MKCKKCGADNPNDSTFCSECGHSLGAASGSGSGKAHDIRSILQEWANSSDDEPKLVEPDDNREVQFVFERESEHGTHRTYVHGLLELAEVQVFSYSKLRIAEDKRKDVCEYLNRFNWNRGRLAKLEIGFDEGNVRAHQSIRLDSILADTNHLQITIDLSIAYLDSAIPGLMEVVFSGARAIDVVRKLDADTEADSTPEDFATETSSTRQWESFPGLERLKNWTQRLKEAVSQPADLDTWKSVGHAIAFESTDRRRVSEVLRRVASDCGMKLLVVPEDQVLAMPMDSSLFYESVAPAIVYFEPGDWRGPRGYDEVESAVDQKRVQAIGDFLDALCDRIQEFNPAKPVVFATSANDVSERLHPALQKVGRFDRIFSIPAKTMAERGLELIDAIGVDHCDDTLSAKTVKVGKVVDLDFNDYDAIQLAALRLRRIAVEEGRKVTFDDLVKLNIWGGVEFDAVEGPQTRSRRQTAYHEAGHALIAVLSSSGNNTPDCTSIVPGRGFGGITSESHSYFYGVTREIGWTYEAFRAEVRVCLGGRAGEEVFGGAECVGSGASGDLSQATNQVRRAFCEWGFAPSMLEGHSAANLAVVDDGSSEAANARRDELVRVFLEQEYASTVSMLRENRPLLDEVVERLLAEPIVDQQELAGLCKKHLHFEALETLDARE